MGWYILVGVLCLAAGLVGGYYGARYLFKRELRKNPPVSEKMIRAMFISMGRKPSEAQIRQVMRSMDAANSK